MTHYYTINNTHLVIDDDFDEIIKPGDIHINVTHLTFGNRFNQPIDMGVIPMNVTHLSFSWSFNQPIIPNVIPINVTHLAFGLMFSQSISDINIETEINFYCDNQNIPIDRIINIFEYCDITHSYNIDRFSRLLVSMSDEYCIGQKYNDVIGEDDVIKIQLTPKIISQKRIKSANKICK